MTNIIGIVDEPVQPGKTDNLDINIHSKALIKYVADTTTPITIGIQGEWGSGKTSLLNSIYHHFDSEEAVKQIWINSWEFSLLSTPEESLLKIVTKIIDELLDADQNKSRKDKIQNGAKKIFSGALRIGASVALGNEAAAVAGELVSGGDANIGALRSQLTELVNDIEQRKTNPYKKIVIYVDDLDRIEPKNAVAILELLKNIFSVPNCVFILAIDYQVVVKGLEHKFGKQTPENEWEFRAFFDKIIQLPFMMPMGQYNIGKYVNTLLKDIGYTDDEGLDETSIREIILRTIGGNPRSIKRLVNSVSLIQIFSDLKISEENENNTNKDNEDEDLDEKDLKFLLFSLLCLQIAYPPIYSLLINKPDFTSWDDHFAFNETKRSEESKETFKEEFENACKTNDFNEEWEKCLYRICYERPRLKPRVADISKFFSYIKDELMIGKQEIIGETIAKIMSETSVTSVTSTDQGQLVLPERQGAYKRRKLDGFETWVIDKKTNDNYNEKHIELISTIYEDLKQEFIQIAEFYFYGGITLYSSKHKFLRCGGKYGKEGTSLHPIKHYENDYKIPLLSGIKTSMYRKYTPGAKSSVHNSHMYGMYIDNLETYLKNRKIILNLCHESYKMAVDFWNIRLQINERNKIIYAKDINIENNDTQYETLALRYLDPDYSYEPK